VVGLLVRVWQMNESLWLDELHTAWVVGGRFDEIAQRASIGNQSALYFLLPWSTFSVGGASEWALRLPSFIGGMMLIICIGWLVLNWSGSLVGAITAAMLVALDRNCIFYAQEARPYAWVQLVAVLLIWAYWKATWTPTRGWQLVATTVGISLFWLHYTAALIVATVAGWAILDRLAAPTPSEVTASNSSTASSAVGYRLQVIGAFCVVFGCLPALPSVMASGSHRQDWAQFVDRAPITAALRWFSLDTYLVVPGSILLVACLATKPLRSWFTNTVERRSESFPAPRFSRIGEPCNQIGRIHEPPWVLLVCCLIVPVMLAWLLTYLDVARLFFPRYLIASAAAPIVLAGLFIARLPNKWWRFAVAATVVLLSVGQGGLVGQAMRDGRLLADRNQNWRGAVQWLRTRPASDRLPIFVRTGYLEADRLRQLHTPLLKSYCLSPVTSLYDLSETDHELIPLPTTQAGQLADEQIEVVTSAGGAWLIINGSRESRAQVRQQFLARLRTTGQLVQLAEERNFGTIDALRVTLVGNVND
jgi:hypothetical protein